MSAFVLLDVRLGRSRRYESYDIDFLLAPSQNPGHVGETYESYNGAVSDDIWAGQLSGYDEFRQASALYRRVFRYHDSDLALNSNLLGALVRNGGSAVGVRYGADLIGFAYGFPGVDATGLYHYSQAAVVDERYHGHGVGRRLKLAQSEVARANGMQRMRWAFDPLFARNAHFNFDSLGARGIAFVPEYYGRPGTERVMVEWRFGLDVSPASAAASAAGPGRGGAEGKADIPEAVRNSAESAKRWGLAVVDPHDPDGAWVPIPGNIHAGDQEPPEHTPVRARLGATLSSLFDKGYELVACERLDGRVSAYCARRSVRVADAHVTRPEGSDWA